MANPITTASNPRVGPLERVRHLKRGTEYEVLGEAELQIASVDMLNRPLRLSEGARLTVYRGSDGKLWARETDEFRDGRFETIASAPTPPGRVGEEVGRELEELRAKSAKATSGEWSAEEAGRITAAGTSPGYDIPVWGTILTAHDTQDVEDGVTHWSTDGTRQANTRFAAACVNYVRKLLALRTLQAAGEVR